MTHILKLFNASYRLTWMSKDGEIRKHRPSFDTTDGFVIPETTDENWAAIEEAFKITHYTSAVLVTEIVEQHILAGRDLSRPIGPFAIRAFALHLVQPTEGGIGLETIISAPTGDPDNFLRSFMQPLLRLLPSGDFPFRPVSISRALQQMGLKVAAGVFISTDMDDPNKQFVSLVVPRVYLDQFRPEHATDRNDFAIKLAALSFLFLSNEYFKSQDNPQNTDPEDPSAE